MTTDDERIAQLEDQIAALRHQLARSPAPGPAGTEPMGRRQLLARLAAGAVGASFVLDGATAPAGATSMAPGLGSSVARPLGPIDPGSVHEMDPLAHAAAFDAFARSLPSFSADALDDYAWVHEDFFGTNVTSGQIGAYGWALATAAGGNLAAGTDYQNAPGFVILGTGITETNGRAALNLGLNQLAGTGAVLPAFDFKTRVAPVLLSGVHHATFRWGLHSDAVGNQPSNGVYFEIVSTASTSTVHCRTAREGVRADTDSTVRMTTSSWATYRIRSDGGGTVYFYIDDALVATMADPTRIPVLPNQRFGPAFSVIKTAGAIGTPRQFRIDYAYLRWAVAR